MQGSRHRKHCHRVKEEVCAFSIEARRRQQKDARRKAKTSTTSASLISGSTYFLMLGPAARFGIRAKEPQRSKLHRQATLRVLLDGAI